MVVTGLSSLSAGRWPRWVAIPVPMAVVILCGLISSTMLNMVVVPSLYLRLGAIRRALDTAQILRRRTANFEPKFLS